MNTMAAALLKVGLATYDQVKLAEQRSETSASQNIDRLKGKTYAGSLQNLEKTATVTEFKKIARDLFLIDSSKETLIRASKLAHNIKCCDGGGKLVRLILAIKNNLDSVKTEHREQIIKRALRSSNPTTDIPQEWRIQHQPEGE